MKCHIPLEELRRLQAKAKVEDVTLTTPPPLPGEEETSTITLDA